MSAFNALPYRKSSLLGALLQNESGGKNVTQGEIGDINNRTGDLAKGFFQITGSTWRDFGGSQYAPDPLKATYAQQADIASRIPLGRWGPNTIAAMRATGMPINTKMTLGQNLAANGEGFGTTPLTATGGALGKQGPTQTGETLDMLTAAQDPKNTALPPGMVELAGEDKQKSLGGLIGDMMKQQSAPPPAMQPLEPMQGGASGNGNELAQMIQQYMQQQTRGAPAMQPPQGGQRFG